MSVLRIALRSLCWAAVTSLLILRPLVALALVPLGVVFFLLAVLGGFVAEMRGLVDHRWTMLAIGLGMIGIVQIYDRLIGLLDGAFTGAWRDHR